MERALHLGLPRQGVDDLVEMKGGLHARERVSRRVGELEVGDQPKRICHRHDTLLQLDPVPRDTSGRLSRWVAPDGLPTARMLSVTRAENACAKMYEMQFRGGLGLPQYGGPSAYDPGGGHRLLGPALVGFLGSSVREVWCVVIDLPSVKPCICKSLQVFAHQKH
jgi:hypothetical protein